MGNVTSVVLEYTPAYMHGMELFRPELHGLQYLEHVPRTYHFVNIDI